jgi:hypothetical protein
VFAVEMLGATAVALFGFCSCRCPAPPARPAPGARMPYTLHALVPCYTESIDIVADTVWAVAEAELPPGAARTVWLLDDGNDAAKAAWVASLKSPDVKYVGGRPKAAGAGEGGGWEVGEAPAPRARRPARPPPPPLLPPPQASSTARPPT